MWICKEGNSGQSLKGSDENIRIKSKGEERKDLNLQRRPSIEDESRLKFGIEFQCRIFFFDLQLVIFVKA